VYLINENQCPAIVLVTVVRRKLIILRGGKMRILNIIDSGGLYGGEMALLNPVAEQTKIGGSKRTKRCGKLISMGVARAFGKKYRMRRSNCR
jgi:hypothetical protein